MVMMSDKTQCTDYETSLVRIITPKQNTKLIVKKKRSRDVERCRLTFGYIPVSVYYTGGVKRRRRLCFHTKS